MKDKALREHLVWMLESRDAHIDFDTAIAGLPKELRGTRPPGAAHSPWEIVEHMRITQADILDFLRNPNYKPLEFPAGYWPAAQAPPDTETWTHTVAAFVADHKAMVKLLKDPAADLMAHVPHGDGQTICREAMLLADHNSYHLGELVTVRRLLGAWGE